MFLKILHPDSGLLDPGILSTSLAIYTFLSQLGDRSSRNALVTEWTLEIWKSHLGFIHTNVKYWLRPGALCQIKHHLFLHRYKNTRTAKKCVGSVADIKAFSASAFVFPSAPDNLSFLCLREDWDEYSSRGRPARKQRNLVYFCYGGG